MNALAGEATYSYWQQNTRALAFSTFLCSIGFSTAWPFLPLMMRSLGITENLESWVGHMLLGFYFVGFATAPVWGGVADHFGRKSMVLRAMLGLGLCMMVLPFAPTPLWFAVILMFMALFNGFNPATMALLAATSPPARIGQAMSIAQGGTLAGQALGPAVGALLAGLFTHPISIFWFSGVLLLIGGMLVATLVRESHRKPAGPWRLEWLGSLRELLAVPGMASLYLLCLVFAILWHGNVPVISLYTMQLIEAQPASAAGYSEAFWIGTIAVVTAVTSITALVVGSRLVDRYNPTRVLVVTTTAAILTHLPLLVLDSPLQLALARGAFGLGVAIMQPALFRLLKERAPAGMDARAISYASSVQMLSMGLAPFVAGLISPALGMRAYFALTIVLTAGALAMWMRRLRAS